MGGLISIATISSKGLSSSKMYAITQSKTIASNANETYYLVADLPDNASIVIEANGCQGKIACGTRLYALRTSASGLNCKQVDLIPDQSMATFYHDGASKLYFCRASHFIGTIRIIDATANIELSLQQVDNPSGLQKVSL